VSKPGKRTKQGMHLHIYYEDVDELRERLISVWCKLDQSVVNHAIDEWRRLSACVDAEGGHLNITYDCNSQNNNVKMVTL